MRAFTTDELSRMQSTQESAMMDTCQVVRRMESGTDDYGYPIEAYEIVWTGECGFDASSNKEVMESGQVAVIDAQIRLPISIQEDFDNLDRIKITYRHGVEDESPQTFEMIGEPERGPSGLVVNLRLVTNGSDE